MPYNKYQPRQPSGVELEVDCKLHFTPVNTDKEPTMCKVQCEALRGKQTMEMKETVSAFKYDSVRRHTDEVICGTTWSNSPNDL